MATRHPSGLIVVHNGHEIGELMRARRQMLGRKLSGVSARTGIHISALSNYELGHTSPTAVLLARLAPGYSWGLALVPRDDQ